MVATYGAVVSHMGPKIMFRTKASTYAILAVVEIAKRQKEKYSDVQAGEIARCLTLPAAYAAKVLTLLARANVLHSDRGPRGGFRLTRAPESIPLLEIVEAVDGSIDAGVNSWNGLEAAERSLRSVDQVFAELASEVRNYLRGRSVADLMEREGEGSISSVATTV